MDFIGEFLFVFDAASYNFEYEKFINLAHFHRRIITIPQIIYIYKRFLLEN